MDINTGMPPFFAQYILRTLTEEPQETQQNTCNRSPRATDSFMALRNPGFASSQVNKAQLPIEIGFRAEMLLSAAK